MNYEIVELQEKKIIGIAARTNNLSPDMTAVIGGLWHKFYGSGIYERIPGKVNHKAWVFIQTMRAVLRTTIVLL